MKNRVLILDKMKNGMTLYANLVLCPYCDETWTDTVPCDWCTGNVTEKDFMSDNAQKRTKEKNGQ